MRTLYYLYLFFYHIVTSLDALKLQLRHLNLCIYYLPLIFLWQSHVLTLSILQPDSERCSNDMPFYSHPQDICMWKQSRNRCLKWVRSACQGAKSFSIHCWKWNSWMQQERGHHWDFSLMLNQTVLQFQNYLTSLLVNGKRKLTFNFLYSNLFNCFPIYCLYRSKLSTVGAYIL